MLPLLDSADFPHLRSAAHEWLAQAAPAAADGQRLAQLAAQALAVPLAESGAARLRLVAEPSRYPLERLERLLLLVSRAIGFVVPQSAGETELAHVRDEQRDYALPATRGHQTSNALAFHSDRCDLNLLMYVRTASAGGQLCVVSYQQAADALGAVDADALAALHDGFPFDLREERVFPSLRWCWRPILWRHAGAIRGHYIRRFIADSQRHADCPCLTPMQLHALDRFDAALEDVRAEHTFSPQPGELLALDNYRVMHARSAYQDAPQQEGGRLALRTWIAPYDSEPLPLTLHPLAGSCRAGSYRGGVGGGADFLDLLGATRAPA